jgi:hypothetical protein
MSGAPFTSTTFRIVAKTENDGTGYLGLSRAENSRRKSVITVSFDPNGIAERAPSVTGEGGSAAPLLRRPSVAPDPDLKDLVERRKRRMLDPQPVLVPFSEASRAIYQRLMTAKDCSLASQIQADAPDLSSEEIAIPQPIGKQGSLSSLIPSSQLSEARLSPVAVAAAQEAESSSSFSSVHDDPPVFPADWLDSEDVARELPGAVLEPPPRAQRGQRWVATGPPTLHIPPPLCSDQAAAALRLARTVTRPLRLFARAEFAYSATDRAYFLQDAFTSCLCELRLPHVCRLKRAEWTAVRAAMGRPRRLSANYLREERKRLARHRENLRRMHLGKLPKLGPEDPPVLSQVPASPLPGVQVSAVHPRSGQILNGTVVSVDVGSGACMVAFENPALGTEQVEECDVFPRGPLSLLHPGTRIGLRPTKVRTDVELQDDAQPSTPTKEGAADPLPLEGGHHHGTLSLVGVVEPHIPVDPWVIGIPQSSARGVLPSLSTPAAPGAEGEPALLHDPLVEWCGLIQSDLAALLFRLQQLIRRRSWLLEQANARMHPGVDGAQRLTQPVARWLKQELESCAESIGIARQALESLRRADSLLRRRWGRPAGSSSPESGSEGGDAKAQEQVTQAATELLLSETRGEAPHDADGSAMRESDRWGSLDAATKQVVEMASAATCVPLDVIVQSPLLTDGSQSFEVFRMACQRVVAACGLSVPLRSPAPVVPGDWAELARSQLVQEATEHVPAPAPVSSSASSLQRSKEMDKRTRGFLIGKRLLVEFLLGLCGLEQSISSTMNRALQATMMSLEGATQELGLPTEAEVASWAQERPASGKRPRDEQSEHHRGVRAKLVESALAQVLDRTEAPPPSDLAVASTVEAASLPDHEVVLRGPLRESAVSVVTLFEVCSSLLSRAASAQQVRTLTDRALAALLPRDTGSIEAWLDLRVAVSAFRSFLVPESLFQ